MDSKNKRNNKSACKQWEETGNNAKREMSRAKKVREAEDSVAVVLARRSTTGEDIVMGRFRGWWIKTGQEVGNRKQGVGFGGVVSVCVDKSRDELGYVDSIFGRSPRHSRDSGARLSEQRAPLVYTATERTSKTPKEKVESGRTTLSTGILHVMNHLCLCPGSDAGAPPEPETRSKGETRAVYCACTLSGDNDACSAS